LTAALYTARANLNPLVLAGDVPGGQLTTTTIIENYPGFYTESDDKTKEPVAGVDGKKLMEDMEKQARHFGAEILQGSVESIIPPSDPSHPFTLKLHPLSSGDLTLYCEALIVATGARPRMLGMETEKKYWTFGVSSCATCDGYFFRRKEVCVIGGGDSAMEEALFLTRHCSKVTIVHRRDEFRASKIMVERALKNEKIAVALDSVPVELVGADPVDPEGGIQVTGIRLKNVKTNEISLLPVQGMFLGIGHIPNTEFLKGVIDLDPNGYAITEHDSTKTKIPGLFVAGDAKDHVFRQAVTAAGMGCMAAIEAERWLELRGK